MAQQSFKRQADAAEIRCSRLVSGRWQAGGGGKGEGGREREGIGYEADGKEREGVRVTEAAERVDTHDLTTN